MADDSTNGVAVRARGLIKRFGDLTAVDGVDLEVAKGTCLGLLGPNGAGKTTTIEMLEGLQRPDAGEIEVLGLRWSSDERRIRERIGVQLQETKLEEKLQVGEILKLFGSFYSERRDLEQLLELVGLRDKRGARFETLSGGQKQRLALGCALVNLPDLLFLDEPTTGLDPQARRRVWEIIGEFKARGGSVLLTTHYMEEAERLADQVVIVDAGKVIAQGSPQDIIASLGVESIVRVVPKDEGGEFERLCEHLDGLAGVREVRRDGAGVELTVTDTQQSLRALLELLDRHPVQIEDLHTHRPTLEDVFVHITGKHLRDE